jgi:hypothetical protein
MKAIVLLCSFLVLPLSAQEGKVPPPFEKTKRVAPLTPEGEEVAVDPFDPETFDGSLPALIQVQVEFIEMPHELLTDLLFMKRPTRSEATELRREVQALVKKGDAKVLETQIVTGRSGEKSLAESIREQIYPTEAEPSSIPNAVTVPDKPEGLSAENIKALAALVGSPTPTSFEVRNVGSTLEIEPTVGADGKFIDLRFAPELLWHHGNTTWQERKDVLGNISKIEVPDFYTVRLSTSLTLTPGAYALAGVVTPRSGSGAADLARKVMVFVKADVLMVR